VLKGLGRLEDKPENVISVFKWIGESPATYVMPSRIAELRYANGKTPEGELVDAQESFRRRREQGSAPRQTTELQREMS
jgi:hypothetical protein